VFGDEAVQLARDRPVGPDDGVAPAGDDRDDRLLVLVPQVTGGAKRLEEAVDAGVLRVGEADVRHERVDRLPPRNGRRQPGLPADVVGAVDTHHERGHCGCVIAVRE